MRKILLTAVIIVRCDLQAMWLEEQIKKILPKRSYVLSTVVRETTSEEKIVNDKANAKEEHLKNTTAISVATSGTAANNEEFSLLLSDIEQSPSELTVTSSINDDTNSAASDYVSMIATQISHEEEIFISTENARSFPNFNSAVPISDSLSDDERIFKMEMSDGEQTSSGYTLSKEYFPTYYREKQICDIRKHRHGTSYVKPNRRKSSMESYFCSHK